MPANRSQLSAKSWNQHIGASTIRPVAVSLDTNINGFDLELRENCNPILVRLRVDFFFLPDSVSCHLRVHLSILVQVGNIWEQHRSQLCDRIAFGLGNRVGVNVRRRCRAGISEQGLLNLDGCSQIVQQRAVTCGVKCANRSASLRHADRPRRDVSSAGCPPIAARRCDHRTRAHRESYMRTQSVRLKSLNDHRRKRRSSAAGPALRRAEHALVAGFLDLHSVAVEVNSAPAKAEDLSNPQTGHRREHCDRPFGFIHFREEFSGLPNRKGPARTFERALWHLRAQHRIVRQVPPKLRSTQDFAEQVPHVTGCFPWPCDDPR